MPEPTKFESTPPVTATIPCVKLTGVSLSVNVSTDFSPALSAVLSAAIAIVGTTMSILSVAARAPATFGLPAASVKAPASIATVPVPTSPAVGVNVAV